MTKRIYQERSNSIRNEARSYIEKLRRERASRAQKRSGNRKSVTIDGNFLNHTHPTVRVAEWAPSEKPTAGPAEPILSEAAKDALPGTSAQEAPDTPETALVVNLAEPARPADDAFQPDADHAEPDKEEPAQTATGQAVEPDVSTAGIPGQQEASEPEPESAESSDVSIGTHSFDLFATPFFDLDAIAPISCLADRPESRIGQTDTEDPICEMREQINSAFDTGIGGEKDSPDQRLPDPSAQCGAPAEETIEEETSAEKDLEDPIACSKPDAGQLSGESPISSIPSIGEGIAWRLERAGITKLDQLAALPVAEVQQKLGPLGRLLRPDLWIAFAKDACSYNTQITRDTNRQSHKHAAE